MSGRPAKSAGGDQRPRCGSAGGSTDREALRVITSKELLWEPKRPSGSADRYEGARIGGAINLVVSPRNSPKRTSMTYSCSRR